jgi:hypothetical protein
MNFNQGQISNFPTFDQSREVVCNLKKFIPVLEKSLAPVV